MIPGWILKRFWSTLKPHAGQHSGKNNLSIPTAGAFHISQKLAEVTILGVLQQPAAVLVNGETKTFTYSISQQKLVISKRKVDLYTETTIEWK